MMKAINAKLEITKLMGTSAWVSGLLLAILGVVGIFFPGELSITIEVFLGWLMIVGSIFWSYHVFQWHRSSFISWLKPLALFVGGFLLLIYPVSGIAAITLLVSFYLFTDAFGSFGMAFEHRSGSGRFWMILNGILSLALAILILIGWPLSSPVYLGIIVGISLLFDGMSLFMFGIAVKNA